MTEYSDFINCLKNESTIEWLTPSQKSIYNKITQGFPTQRIINVYGKHGAGKTFLGWILEKNGFGHYHSGLEDFKENGEISINKMVIIDNFQSDKNLHRDFRSKMGDRNTTKPFSSHIMLFQTIFRNWNWCLLRQIRSILNRIAINIAECKF